MLKSDFHSNLLLVTIGSRLVKLCFSVMKYKRNKLKFYLKKCWKQCKAQILQKKTMQSSMIIMVMMMNCFFKMFDQQNNLSLISSWDHCRRFSLLQIFNLSQAGLKPEQNLISCFAEWIWAEVLTATYININ